MKQIDKYSEQDNQFYPTPEELVNRMIDGLDFNYIETILEPSAGKGDILRVIAQKEDSYRTGNFDVDCIELDPNLRQILKYNFSKEKLSEIRFKMSSITDSRKYDYEKGRYIELSKKQTLELKALKKEEAKFFSNGIHIVYDDFLRYQSLKKYDLIIMNPPFANGEKHLLKALDMQKNGGNIICILNAETLKNPYSETRKELVKQLELNNANIEYIQDGFMEAERKTGVEIVLIKIHIKAVAEDSEIYRNMEKAQQQQEYDTPETTEIEIADFIRAAINKYQIEVKAGVELIKQYKALCPYITRGFSQDNFDKEPILVLKMYSGRDYDGVSVNEYIKRVRSKYWSELLTNRKFVGKLTSKLQSDYREKVGTLTNYEFNEFNIYQIMVEINAQIKTGIEEEIITMFDKLTTEHSWYPECKKNKHYYNGWKTNIAHKINKKVIIPFCDVWDSWNKDRPYAYKAVNVLSDIEKILNYLDGNMTKDVSLSVVINNAFDRGVTKNIECKFFKATFYKKGTCHITFTNQELIDRFNIYVSKNKNWLPPCYGTAKYSDMTDEEKQVIDEFQGEESYNKVMANKDYYLGSADLLRIEGR